MARNWRNERLNEPLCGDVRQRYADVDRIMVIYYAARDASPVLGEMVGGVAGC
jgi:hypothetical protein